MARPDVKNHIPTESYPDTAAVLLAASVLLGSLGFSAVNTYKKYTNCLMREAGAIRPPTKADQEEIKGSLRLRGLTGNQLEESLDSEVRRRLNLFSNAAGICIQETHRP